MSRIIWRRAHPVRLPDRINTPPHLELREADQREQFIRDGLAELVQELDRDLRRDGEQ